MWGILLLVKNILLHQSDLSLRRNSPTTLLISLRNALIKVAISISHNSISGTVVSWSWREQARLVSEETDLSISSESESLLGDGNMGGIAKEVHSRSRDASGVSIQGLLGRVNTSTHGELQSSPLDIRLSSWALHEGWHKGVSDISNGSIQL